MVVQINFSLKFSSILGTQLLNMVLYNKKLMICSYIEENVGKI